MSTAQSRSHMTLVVDTRPVVYNLIGFKCRKMRTYKPGVIKAAILFSLFGCLVLGYSVYSSFQCDFEDGKILVRTPGGGFIKKFDTDQPVKKFSLLSKKCDYQNEKLNCPDIRATGETMMRQVQLATVRMLIAFDKVCRKHGIKYWLWRGALLGAYRHKGFIPWDNELDIGMMKDQYEKFRMVSHDMPTDIFLQNTSSDPGYAKAKHGIIAKLRDGHGCFGYCIRTGCQFHDGLMIDIFGFQENGQDSIIETTENRVHFDVKKSDIFPLKEMEFEGYNLYIPNKYDVILQKNYGQDYYTLPPRNNRCPPGRLIGLPWFSCNDLGNMDMSLRNYYLYLSVVSRLKLISWFL